MPSFAEKARKAQEDKRAGREEKDPADLSGATEPDWDNPEPWGSDSDSASGNADDSADVNDGQAHRDVPKSPGSAGSSRTPRRPGRPRGPKRVPLSVRILPATDRKLTAAVEQTGLNPQTLVEQALEAHFRRLKVEDPGPAQAKEGAA
jgi:hypothetical protein